MALLKLGLLEIRPVIQFVHASLTLLTSLFAIPVHRLYLYIFKSIDYIPAPHSQASTLAVPGGTHRQDFRRMELKGRIVVFSIIGCPHCMRAKNTLQELELPYHDIQLDSFPQYRDWVKERTGRTTVPQIFFNADHIGGNDDLQKLVADPGLLKQKIEDVKNNEPPADAPEVPDPTQAVAGSTDFTCEPDEYAHLVEELKNSGIIQDRRKFTTHKSVFTGKDFVDWVVKTKQLERSVGVEMGQELINRKFGNNVKKDEVFRDDGTFYRLLEDDETTALNHGEVSNCEPLPAGQLGEEIRKLILKIYAAFLSPDGKKVNYAGIRGSDEFQKYCELASLLQRVNVADASREEKLAFFVNIYNAQVIHANVSAGPPQNMWQRYKFFNTQRYIIGGHTYSLQDIENGVLRSNRKGVGMLTRPFSKSDPRLKVALEVTEPLIHFALVCGAKSCPPIKTYSAEGIDDQLKLAAESFLEGEDGVQVDMKNKRVQLSQIFKWYREDFGKNDKEVVQFLLDLMSEGEKKAQLKELLDGNNFKVVYMHYDWSTNS